MESANNNINTAKTTGITPSGNRLDHETAKEAAKAALFGNTGVSDAIKTRVGEIASQNIVADLGGTVGDKIAQKELEALVQLAQTNGVTAQGTMKLLDTIQDIIQLNNTELEGSQETGTVLAQAHSNKALGKTQVEQQKDLEQLLEVLDRENLDDTQRDDLTKAGLDVIKKFGLTSQLNHDNSILQKALNREKLEKAMLAEAVDPSKRYN